MGYESDLCCLVGSFDQPWMNTALQLVLEGIRVGTVLPGSPLVREEATKICARVSKLGNIFFRLRKVDCPSDRNKALEDVGCALPGLDHLVVPQVPLVLALLHGRPQPKQVETSLGDELRGLCSVQLHQDRLQLDIGYLRHVLEPAGEVDHRLEAIEPGCHLSDLVLDQGELSKVEAKLFSFIAPGYSLIKKSSQVSNQACCHHVFVLVHDRRQHLKSFTLHSENIAKWHFDVFEGHIHQIKTFKARQPARLRHLNAAEAPLDQEGGVQDIVLPEVVLHLQLGKHGEEAGICSTHHPGLGAVENIDILVFTFCGKSFH